MDVPKLPEAASLPVPGESATENDITVADVWEYLTHDEWEVALDLLEELGDVRPLPLRSREIQATAAEQMRLETSAAWCHWRCYETRNGTIRADLTLRPATEARRQTPLFGAGVLRPVWNIGNRTPMRQHLEPGQVITMHEDRSVAGTAVVVEVQRPSATPTA